MPFPKFFNRVIFPNASVGEQVEKILRGPYLISHIFVFLLVTLLPCYLVTFLKPQKTLAIGGPKSDLCCPQGYGTGAMDCPALPRVDRTKQCCKRTSFGQYDIVDKIPCDDPDASGKSKCEAEGGRWDENEGECYELETSTDGTCPPGEEPVKTKFGIMCKKILFKGEGQKIRVNVKTCGGHEVPGLGLVGGTPGIETALGCIPTDPEPFIGWVFTLASFLGGGIAFLLMAWGTFLTIISSGDPEKLKQGKDIIVSAISGLLFIIFAVFLLRLIGVDILRIPGFQ